MSGRISPRQGRRAVVTGEAPVRVQTRDGARTRGIRAQEFCPGRGRGGGVVDMRFLRPSGASSIGFVSHGLCDLRRCRRESLHPRLQPSAPPGRNWGEETAEFRPLPRCKLHDAFPERCCGRSPALKMSRGHRSNFAPAGRRAVAAGEAPARVQTRDGARTRGIVAQEFCPGTGRGGGVVDMRFLRPSGASSIGFGFHGLRDPRHCRRESLHPWLQPSAPRGR
jgi:hypothetical protein